MKYEKDKKFFIILLSFIISSFSILPCYSAEKIITSDTLEYDQKTFTYIAKGNVKIQEEDVTIEADEIIYNEESSDVIATGSVIYIDKDVSITASRAELNLKTKKGTIYDAKILIKKENYHISGAKIEKKGDKYYSSPEATFTTCDSPLPAWCFKGKDINASIGEEIKVKNTTLRIKNIPIIYTPYFRAPILTERKTGFLLPLIGQSESRGFQLKVPFYWAITENRDLTFDMELYTKRGIGKGLEYRYVEPFNANGQWWFYHLRDKELKKDFFEVRIRHEQNPTDRVRAFLNINFINEEDYYREFTDNIESRSNRFIESNGEFSITFKNSRAFFLSQYWIDLKDKDSVVPQRLPEIGFILNPIEIKNLMFSSHAILSNFWKEEGIHGQRLDIYPKIFYSFGEDIVISQMLGLRETLYSLQSYEHDGYISKESINYNIRANTRLKKRYGSFIHILEPSVGYTFINRSEDNSFLFDSTELFKKTSLIEFSLLNRLLNENGEFLVIKATQGFESNYGDRAFLPLKFEIGIKKPLSMRFETEYNVHSGKVENINSDFSVNAFSALISASQRYNRSEDILYYNAGIGINPYKSLFLDGRIWYDAKAKETKDFTLNLKYLSQCWGINIQFNKRPDDFNISVMIELKGITKSIRF